MRVHAWCCLLVGMMVLCTGRVAAQELPYFVTYSHHMEEPGTLDIELKTASGQPRQGDGFVSASLELEYGTRAWWTTELYLDGQSTQGESTVFTGFQIENRFRPLLAEHRVNPVLYVEFEDINAANKSVLEVVGHDGAADFLENNRDTHGQKKREAELKLILSSNAKGWNFAENVIAEKNLSNSPWEFGYAVGASRPLRLMARGGRCRVCAEDVQVGVEMYGGLGERYSFGTRDTSHYAGPTANWNVPHGPTLSFSPAFGVNDYSVPHIYRVGISYEPGQVRRWFRAQKENQ